MIFVKDQHKSLAELSFTVLFLLALNHTDKAIQKKRYSPGEEHSVHRLSRLLIIVKSHGEIKHNMKKGKRSQAPFLKKGEVSSPSKLAASPLISDKATGPFHLEPMVVGGRVLARMEWNRRFISQQSDDTGRRAKR